jgi:competence protein ComEA
MNTFARYRGYAILSLVFTIIFGGYILWERWPQPEPITIIVPTATSGPTPTTAAPSPTPAPLRVHVAGAVQRPGVYILSPDDRLIDAIDAAGGLAINADPARINLADFLRDGQQIFVPYEQTPVPPSPTPLPTPSAATQVDQQPATAGGLMNINTASAAELETLPGIGPVYAERIIAYRDEHGPFADPIEIMQVKGIGPASYEQIKERIITD